MNVAVILDPRGFNFIHCKCWSMDVVLKYGPFSTSWVSKLCLFFITWMISAQLIMRAKRILNESIDERQRRLSEQGARSTADHICLNPSPTAWSCSTAWADTVRRRSLFAVEKMHTDEKCLAQASDSFALKGFCLFQVVRHAVLWMTSLWLQREPLTSLLVLFPVPVCPQCTSSV